MAALVGVAALASCKKEDPPPSYPPTSVAPYTPAQPPAATGAPPAAASAAAPAAIGLPCASDQDLQCAFAHCLGNRCGGCRNGADCKPGAQCLPTWLGAACFPGGTQALPPAAAPASPSSSNPSAPLDALRARCVQQTNELRARVSRSALLRRAEREACIDGEAQSDAASGTAHGAFGRCQESAQNECPGWPGPLDQVLDRCLAQMFAEGPGPFQGHGHYVNLTDPSFSGVSCGFSTKENGQIWLVQDFYR